MNPLVQAAKARRGSGWLRAAINSPQLRAPIPSAANLLSASAARPGVAAITRGRAKISWRMVVVLGPVKPQDDHVPARRASLSVVCTGGEKLYNSDIALSQKRAHPLLQNAS